MKWLVFFLGCVVAFLVPEIANSAPTTDKRAAETSSTSSSFSQVKTVRIGFEQAESEVLMRLRTDLPRLEAITSKLAILDVSAIGDLPPNYRASLRNKIERVLLTSNRLRVVECPSCEASRLVRDESGKLRYETSSSEPGRTAKIASEAGVEDVLTAELEYSPSDVTLRVRLVQAARGEILWSREYSTAEVVRNRDNYVAQEYDLEEVGRGDSLSRILIGEIAFSAVFSPGIMSIPTIDEGMGTTRLFYPSADLLIGEKFDRGYKRFGFVFGAAVNAAEGPTFGKILPYAIRIAPQYRYTFNPYNTNSARFSIMTELGGLISSGMVTAYLGLGPELQMVKRFSVSIMPMFILPTTVKGSQIIVQNAQGQMNSQTQPDQGRFGGFALLIKGSINW